jgi:hypothetical protein
MKKMQTRRELLLAEMDAVVPWGRILALIAPHYPNPGPSQVPPLPRETRLTVIAKTVREAPPGATHWSRSTMAGAVGISPPSVGRIRAEAGLKPHVVRRFKVSNDPMSEEKVPEIVGSIWIRRKGPSCSAWLRNPRSGRSTTPSPGCRSRRGAPPP